MNKAFVREPEPDGRAFCPTCGSLGDTVGRVTLDHHIQAEFRSTLGLDAWFCPYADCATVYFDLYQRTVSTNQLHGTVFPKDIDAPICACFGFTMDQLHQAISDRDPMTVRELLAKSKSREANCAVLAANGRCCMQDVQRLYIRGIATK